MPYISPNKFAGTLQEFVAHATKYATGTTTFGGLTTADIEAMDTAFQQKWRAKIDADRAANVAGLELDTIMEADRDKLIRYRLSVPAETGRDSEATKALPRLSARASAKSSGPKGPEDP
jgi:hypothetical protein